MANEILFAGIGDLTLAETLSSEFLLLIADRRSLPMHPALAAGYKGQVTQSNVIKVSHVGLMGYDLVASTGDGSAAANTALTDGSSTITVAKYSKVYEASDLARMVAGGTINPALFAQDAVQATSSRLTDLIANVADGFTATGGVSGADLTAADIVAALGAAEVANMTGPFMGVLHGQQWADLMSDLGTAVGGALQFQAATADLVALRGEAYKGSWLGVDWFLSNRVPTDGTDRKGAIFGPGGIVWADGAPPIDNPAEQMLIGGKIMFERDRNAAAGLTKFVQHAYLGVSLGIQNGITIGSDA